MSVQEFHARSSARVAAKENERLDREQLRIAEMRLLGSLKNMRTEFAQQELNRAIDIIRDAIRISLLP
jgi:hypothetical protein